MSSVLVSLFFITVIIIVILFTVWDSHWVLPLCDYIYPAHFSKLVFSLGRIQRLIPWSAYFWQGCVQVMDYEETTQRRKKELKAWCEREHAGKRRYHSNNAASYKARTWGPVRLRCVFWLVSVDQVLTSQVPFVLRPLPFVPLCLHLQSVVNTYCLSSFWFTWWTKLFQTDSPVHATKMEGIQSLCVE